MKIVLLIAFIVTGQFSFSQDTSKVVYQWNSTWLPLMYPVPASSTVFDYSITHAPTKGDSVRCGKDAKLISAQPKKKNYEVYYDLACSLWELNRLQEAEQLFLKIMSSQKPYYAGTYYHSSDVPGDKTTNTYGYGSYTSNFKNYASRYLAKIYIEEKQFDKALVYIELADKTYTIQQNCGTGYNMYHVEIDGLYYEGLEKSDSIIHMFLPGCFELGFGISNGMLVRALKKNIFAC